MLSSQRELQHVDLLFTFSVSIAPAEGEVGVVVNFERRLGVESARAGHPSPALLSRVCHNLPRGSCMPRAT
jgi:hypothetical protein